jgi:2-haloacid dehalogenase
MNQSPYEVYSSIFKKHSLITNSLNNSELEICFRSSWKEMSQKTHPDHKDRYANHPKGIEGWWRELIEIYLKNINNKKIEKEVVYREIFDWFDHPENWRLEPTFHELIHFCKLEKIGLGILSNWDLRLRNLLLQKNILGYFDIILISAEFGYEKPSPLFFKEAETLCNTQAHNIFYIGDKIELDYIPSKKRNWNSYILSKDKSENFHIQTLSQIKEQLKQL